MRLAHVRRRLSLLSGVSIGSTWRRLLYALRFKDKNLLFSSGVNGSSRILYVRDPRDRVAKVAPFLTLDSDPYPAIVGDRIVWIVDGYTTTDGRSSICEAAPRYANHQAWFSCEYGSLNHLDMKLKMICNDGGLTTGCP